MTPTRLQLRLNLIRLVTEHVRTVYLDSDPAEGQKEMLQLLDIYRRDTERRMRRQAGDLIFLTETLKVGIRLAGALMQGIQEHEPHELRGWRHGAAPSNIVQCFYDLIYETSLELAWSIQAIESEYPHLKRSFDLERALYRESVWAELNAGSSRDTTS